MKKNLFIIHLFLSSMLLVVSVYWMVQDIFSIGKYSIGNVFLFTCPACLVIPFVFIALGYLRIRPVPRIYYSPLIIGAATLIFGIILFSFENTYPDFAFMRYFSYYRDVVGLIDENKITLNQKSFALLPEKYKQIFSLGPVFVSGKGGKETIYFEDGSDRFDHVSWGYIYRSDGAPPDGDDKCVSWRNIVPPTPHWYYCDVHGWVGFLEESKP